MSEQQGFRVTHYFRAASHPVAAALLLGVLISAAAPAAPAAASAAPGASAASSAAAPAAPGAAPGSAACQAVARLSAGPVVIASARLVAAGPLPQARGPLAPPGPPARPIQLPEHCLIQGALAPRTGAGGRKYQIGFQLRLPLPWNGRFLYQGGGGLDGIVLPAIGPARGAALPALARGFAVVSTDAGHQGPDASFGFDQQARLDFAYAAIGKVTAEAKDIIDHFYGRQPRYSYFVGCSSGGREAMMAAQRFPYDFDGIVAGDPGFNLSAAAIEEMWDVDQFAKVAPRDAQGHPILSRAFTDAQLKLVSAAVLRQCDRLDGLADGMINDVGDCHFDPAVLECRPGATRGAGGAGGAARGCLSAAKVAALRAVFGGAHDSAGRSLYPGWPYDAGISGAGWRVWKLGSSPSAAPNALNATLGVNALQGYFLTPPQPGMTAATFDFDRDPARVAQTAAISDAVSTFMTSFVAHHGRMLIYQGMSDPVFSADAIMRWYRQLSHDNASVQDWARLFLVPGMNHCGGGPATDDFDALDAIEGWTERGAAPDRLIASGASMPGVTRPLCPYPKYARYIGGNPKSAASFACR